MGGSGPESVVLTKPDQWQSLIRRLVAAERANLAAIIDRWLAPKRAAPTAPELEAWHNAAATTFVNQVKTLDVKWPVPLDHNYCQFSYEFVLGPDVQQYAARGLINTLERASAEIKDLVWTGWGMFYCFNDPEDAPRMVQVRYEGQGPTPRSLRGQLTSQGQPDSDFARFLEIFGRRQVDNGSCLPRGQAGLSPSTRSDRKHFLGDAKPRGNGKARPCNGAKFCIGKFNSLPL